MTSKLLFDITPAHFDKASKAARRGKASARQLALTAVESQLEDLVHDRDPDCLPGLFSDYTPVVQSFWAEEDGELHVVALVPAQFVIPTSELPDELKSQLSKMSESEASTG